MQPAITGNNQNETIHMVAWWRDRSGTWRLELGDLGFSSGEERFSIIGRKGYTSFKDSNECVASIHAVKSGVARKEGNCRVYHDTW
jgi:hypothetical protein